MSLAALGGSRPHSSDSIKVISVSAGLVQFKKVVAKTRQQAVRNLVSIYSEYKSSFKDHFLLQ